MVTGVLPLALEEATKTIQSFLLTGKEYTCVMTLHGDVDLARLLAVLEEFVGDLFQRPPVRQPLRETFEEEESTISGMSRLTAERSCLESVVRLAPTYGSLSSTSARACRW